MLGNKILTISEIIQTYGLLKSSYAKSLGQHFLTDPNLLRRIVRSAGDVDGCDILEVGPGPGGLTRALLETSASRIVAIEKDLHCLHALDSLVRCYPDKLELIHGDALVLSWDKLSLVVPFKIVANLPYNIATVLIIKWLKCFDYIQSITVLIQKEVAERICAKPRTALYGRLSVITQLLSEPRICFDIPPKAFTPPPKVYSSVLSCIPKILSNEEKRLLPFIEEVTQIAFSQRRKMLRAIFKNIFKTSDWEYLQDQGILPEQRPEELSPQHFQILGSLFLKQEKCI